jgi:hypothetical protein
VKGGSVNGGYEAEGIWLMDFVYTYMKQNDETPCNCFKSGAEWVKEGR